MKLAVLTSSISLAGALFATAAIAAAPGPNAEARLKAPVTAPVSRVLDGRIWRCENDVCLAGKSTKSQPPVRECARVARELGALVSYRTGATVLSEDQLAACNPSS